MSLSDSTRGHANKTRPIEVSKRFYPTPRLISQPTLNCVQSTAQLNEIPISPHNWVGTTAKWYDLSSLQLQTHDMKYMKWPTTQQITRNIATQQSELLRGCNPHYWFRGLTDIVSSYCSGSRHQDHHKLIGVKACTSDSPSQRWNITWVSGRRSLLLRYHQWCITHEPLRLNPRTCKQNTTNRGEQTVLPNTEAN